MSAILTVAINGVIPWAFQVIKTNEDYALASIYVLVAFVIDAYFILNNTLLVVLRTELSFIEDRLKLGCTGRANRLLDCPRQLGVLTNAYKDVLPLMSLFAKFVAVPLAYSTLLLIFEGTVQLFQFYILVAAHQLDGIKVVDILSYVLWFVPFAGKLCVTMHLTTSTTEKVSEFLSSHNEYVK